MGGLSSLSRVEDPARVLALQAVQRAKDVEEVPLGQPGQDRTLCRVPARERIGAVGGERDHLALRRLHSRGVEVAAEDAMALGGPREREVDRLAGLDLE